LCVALVWRRVAQLRFRNEETQAEFLGHLEEPLQKRDFENAAEICEADHRAVPRLALLALANRDIGFAKVRQLVLDRFQRDVLADLENRLAWVNTVIKSAPMVGLLGTVIGMMGAFGKLASAENVEPSILAEDISLALITTASGLAIAIPLVMCMTVINVRIRKLEDLVSVGIAHFLEIFRASQNK
jgi:biopolymer transport protein ExbB